MSKDNEPQSVERGYSANPVDKFFEVVTGGAYKSQDHSTTITGPNDASYSGHGTTSENADRDAGEKYRTGNSDK